ncbi:Pleckstrin-like protein [Mycena indigotica]|uniref:Pleckstrin-like protein n=1 Tax=Mycena indigotica TaxID=2126181 RepID=A0A8H6T881_9AGAR|nr:Pleckstrin-like protein [Mycena indigotica]KAF7312574.1 Pleckstrin-like protein [Mycena indigotica]
MNTLAAAPPSPQEVHRKLSVHSMSYTKSPRAPHPTTTVSGTESDSDSLDTIIPSTGNLPLHQASAQPNLSSIAERRSQSGEDSEEEDEGDEEVGGWRSADRGSPNLNSAEESVIKAGYLWKKGERRKTWKKRWFVLRTAHLAYYKTAAEYQLLRLLDLSDVHSCTKVALKRHENTFGLVSPVRTFYLQAKDPGEVHDWVKAIEEARQALQAASGSATQPIPIPAGRGRGRANAPPPVTPSPPSHGYSITSSDSDDASPNGARSYSLSSSQPRPQLPTGGTSPSAKAAIDPAKTILSGYLMKCGSKRRNWRKRWFVLSAEQLVYSGSHMDTKPHRRFPFKEILDALEYELAPHRQTPSGGSGVSPSVAPAGDDDNNTHTFKIVTTKRTLLLCAPNEEDEIKWLGAIRALIARRSGTGGVPGDSTKIMGTSDVSPSPSHISGVGGGGGASTGLMTRVRRLSASQPLQEP